MKPDYRQLYERELKVMHIISKVESRGMAFDSKRARRKARPLRKKMETALDNMKLLAGDWLTMHPPKLVKAMKQLGVKEKQLVEKGKVTTEADILNRALSQGVPKRAQEFIESLLIYRAYQKTCNTYLLPLAKRADYNNGVVETSINPTDTRTGRMASRNPNLQNIPTLQPRRGRTAGGENPVRSCFVCRPGFANYYFDYAQMEIAVFGLYTGEALILDTYKSGGDIHGVMADTLYGTDHTEEERNRTKDTNYGIIYGMGIQGMAKYRAVSIAEAKDFLRFYHRKFPSVHEFLDECRLRLKLDGYVEDWFGRRYHVPYGQAYKAVNCLVQGGCAQIFKIALLELNVLLGHSTNHNILLPVHDEFQIERKINGHEETFITGVTHKMINIPQLLDRGLELRVDVSKSMTNWAEKEKIEI